MKARYDDTRNFNTNDVLTMTYEKLTHGNIRQTFGKAVDVDDDVFTFNVVECLMEAINKVDDFEYLEEFQAFVRKSAENKCRNHVRLENNRQRVLDENVELYTKLHYSMDAEKPEARVMASISFADSCKRHAEESILINWLVTDELHGNKEVDTENTYKKALALVDDGIFAHWQTARRHIESLRS